MRRGADASRQLPVLPPGAIESVGIGEPSRLHLSTVRGQREDDNGVNVHRG